MYLPCVELTKGASSGREKRRYIGVQVEGNLGIQRGYERS